MKGQAMQGRPRKSSAVWVKEVGGDVFTVALDEKTGVQIALNGRLVRKYGDSDTIVAVTLSREQVTALLELLDGCLRYWELSEGRHDR